MFVIIGIAVVFIGVVGGFIAEGGPIPVLIQPVEFMIIGGAAIGAFLAGTPLKIIKQVIAAFLGTLKGDKFSKQTYVDVLKMLYELFQLAKENNVFIM